MKGTNGHSEFIFGDYRLETESQTLWRKDQEIHLAKRPFDLLRFLIENRERLVGRNELLDKFWDGHDVYDDALRKAIGTIRNSLNDKRKPATFIETRYGSGFRFIGKIEEKLDNSSGKQHFNGPPQQLSSINNDDEKSAEEVSGVTDDAQIGRQNGRYVFIAASIIIILFISLGFYAYFPSGDGTSESSLVEGAKPVRSIAVLPLKNLTGDANSEYFSDGVTESIITELSRIKELRVISRTSTFALKGKEIDPREIGRTLEVDALLEGRVQKEGDLLTADVRLISTRDGHIIWTSRKFERLAAYAQELQDTISCNIALELRTELCGTLPTGNTSNSDAYNAYLQGRYHWNKRTAAGIKRSIEFYDQAIAFDSNYALAYAGLAESYVQGIWHVPFDSKEVLPKAEEAALKAVELDDTLAEAHSALAGVYSLNWKWPESGREIMRAIELNPRYARAHHVQAFYFLTFGRYDEAIAAIERAKELDPLNLVINTDLGVILFTANRTEEAFQQWQKTIDLDTSFALAYEHRADALQVLGNESMAAEDMIKAMELNGEPTEKIAAFRETVSKHGLKEIWLHDLKDLLTKKQRGENISPVDLAWVYTSLGDKDAAFSSLEDAVRERSAAIVLFPGSHFDPLRSDPRYLELLERIGLI